MLGKWHKDEIFDVKNKEKYDLYIEIGIFDEDLHVLRRLWTWRNFYCNFEMNDLHVFRINP